MGNTLITISRQHGSGGTKVAQILAEKLGIWYYNREILYIAADKIGYDSLDEKSMDEINYKKASQYMEGLSIMTGSRNHIPVYNQMFKEQSKIIKKLAGYGSGVFLGRCADYVLKDEPGVCSVYLYAEESYRIKHLSEKEGRAVTAEENPKRRIKMRSSYYSYYTGRNWYDMENYDLAINLATIEAEEAAQLILDYMKKENKTPN